ncbi:MAG: hypothetical protein ACE5FQ_05590 [Thiogranum sp.]
MKVVRTIAGHRVVVTPVFKDKKHRPAYWRVSINDHVLAQTFASTSDAFRFAGNTELLRPH